MTRSALQNAASVAGTVLTTESLVADKKEPRHPPLPLLPIWAACINIPSKQNEPPGQWPGFLRLSFRRFPWRT